MLLTFQAVLGSSPGRQSRRAPSSPTQVGPLGWRTPRTTASGLGRAVALHTGQDEVLTERTDILVGWPLGKEEDIGL